MPGILCNVITLQTSDDARLHQYIPINAKPHLGSAVSKIQTKLQYINYINFSFPMFTACPDREILQYCKNYGSSDQLTFISQSGSNCSAFYLYRATSAGLSVTPF